MKTKENNNLIRLTITRTARPRPGARGWQWDNEKKDFESLEAALQWLENTYGIKKPRRVREGQAIYVDGPNGTAIRVGWVRSYWEDDDQNRGKKIWCSEWISFQTVSRPQPFALA